MIIERTSMLTGKKHTQDLPVTEEQLTTYYKGVGLLHEIFPQLNADQREFIKTGITKEEWDAVYNTDTEENTTQDLIPERP
jgi:hypothetical protein